MQMFIKKVEEDYQSSLSIAKGLLPLAMEISHIEVINTAFNKPKSQKNNQKTQTTKDIA